MKPISIVILLGCAMNIMAQNRIFTVAGDSLEMVPIKGGVFYMGAQSTDPSAPNYDAEAYDNEGPVHKVQVSDFWISKYPVSQGLWEAVTGLTPHNDDCIIPEYCQKWYTPYIDAADYPAYYISYDDARKFINILNNSAEIAEQITFGYKEGFYAPTEAQWEYAARGGENADYYIYAGSNNYDDVAWVAENCKEIPKIGRKQPNNLGLYDMCGGLAEWCRDKYAPYDEYKLFKHPDSIVVDPENTVGNYQVQRGGRFPRPAVHSRIASRSYANTDTRLEYHGLRVVMQAPIPTDIPTTIQSTTTSPTFIQKGTILSFQNISKPTLLTIYNLDGKSLYTQTLTPTKSQVNLSLPTGMYVMVCGTLRKLIAQ